MCQVTPCGLSSTRSAKRPEGARALALEAGAGTGQGEILARERGPGEIGAAGQIGRGQRGHVGDAQMIVPPIGGVGGPLLRVEVIGEQALPVGAKASAGHAAASEKLIEISRWLPLRLAGAMTKRDAPGVPSRLR